MDDRWVLKVYTNRRMYLLALAAGGARYDLDGEVAGEVTDEQAAIAVNQLADIDASRVTKAAAVRSMLARNSRRSQKPAPELAPKPAPQRLSLAGLKAAAQARKAAAAGAAA